MSLGTGVIEGWWGARENTRHSREVPWQIAEVGWNFRETGPMRVYIVDLTSQTGLHSNFEKRFLHYTFILHSVEDW